MSDQKFESWAVVEVMGHNRYAGFLTEQAVGGCNFVRVDVPACGDRQAFTKLLGQGSIFAITPCDEATARAAAESFRSKPLEVAMLTHQPAARSGGADAWEPEDDDWDDEDDADDEDGDPLVQHMRADGMPEFLQEPKA